ncbi:MAG: class II glutamine amidotransferase [Elusimicrobiota bacterium]
MCRIFAQLSVTPHNPSEYLVKSRASLLAQSKAKKNFLQKDGWGVATLAPGGFHIFKSPNPAYRESPLFIEQAAKSSSRIVIAHIRAASNPLKLPRKDLIAREHNQPFGFGRLAFAHNGTLNIAAAARDQLLGAYRRKLEGKNDSEIYFWILCKWYDKTKKIPEALVETVREIWQLWRSLPKSKKNNWKFPYTGLNAAISDGRNLWALCHSLMLVERKSLCLRDQPYNRMALRLENEGRRLVVGSEKFSPDPGWRVMAMHRLLKAWPEKGKIQYEVKPFLWKH